MIIYYKDPYKEDYMKKKIIFVFSILFVASFIGCGNGHEGTIEASGTLEAIEVSVSSKVSAQIEKIVIDQGSIVKEGDTLMILDRSTLELQWKQAKGGMDLAEAQYRLLLNGARVEDIKQAEEAVTQADATLKSAQDDFTRMKDLLASKTVTQKQYDDADSRFTIAQAQFNSAKQNLQRLQRFARPEDLAAAKARYEQAKASSDLMKKQYNDAVIVAPVPGIITSKPVEEGELVNTGTTVTKIIRPDIMRLMIYINETDLAKIKVGNTADVVIDGMPDKSFPGKVSYISPLAEFTPKNVQTKEDRTKLVFGVRIEINNSQGILKAGMPADAYVHVQG